MALPPGMVSMVICGRVGRIGRWFGVKLWVLMANDVGIGLTQGLLGLGRGAVMTGTRMIVVVTMLRVAIVRGDRKRSVVELTAKLGLYIILGSLMTA